jgi:hypothetical protein
MLIIICGLPGSGKTTLARALSKRLSASHISSDLIRKEMFPKPAYSEAEKEAVYMEMRKRVKKTLSEGIGVVVDATFYKKRQREYFVAVARECGARNALILCVLEEQAVESRLAKRKQGGVSDADYKVYLKLKKEFEPIAKEHLEIDSALPVRERIERVLKFIG